MDKIIADVLDAEKVNNKDYYVAVINGDDCKKKDSFLREVGIALKFPSYYGQNLDALWDCLND